MKLVVSAPADDDLASIWAYSCKEWGREQADLYADALTLRLAWLVANPGLWHPRPELGKDVFTYPHGSHLVIFQPRENNLVILRVLHQRMDPDRHKD